MKDIQLRQSRSLGDIITDTFSYFRIHFTTLGKGLVLFSLPLIIISGTLIGSSMEVAISGELENPDTINEITDFGLKFFSGLFLLMVTFMLIAVIVFKHIQLVDEGVENIEIGMLTEDIARNIPGVLGIFIVIGFASMAGFMFFVIPGVYISIKLSLAPAIYVVEKADFGEALSESWKLTQDYWWFTFGVSFVISLITSVASNVVIIPFYLVLGIFTFVSEGSDMESFGTIFSVFYGLVMIITGLLYCFPIISQAFVYFNLEERKSGHGLAEKIDSLGRE